MTKKIKIALVKPQLTGHRNRGTGIYFEELSKYLAKNPLVDLYISQNGTFLPHTDLVHFPYFDPFFLTLSMPDKIPFVVTVHDMAPLLFPQHFPKGLRGWFAWQIQKHRLGKASGIITDSQSAAEGIKQIVGNTVPIFPVYLAAASVFKKNPPERIQEIRKKYQLPERFVLYVGDIGWNKNLLNLILAVKQLNVSCVLVSKTLKKNMYDLFHPSLSYLVPVFNELENDKRFFILNNITQDELVALYNAASVCSLPSWYEGFGLPVVEAFASGCPVVCSDRGSLPEIAKDAALFVNPADVSSIADGLGEMLFSKKLQNKYREKGLKRAQTFSWKKTAEKTIQIYQQCIKNLS